VRQRGKSAKKPKGAKSATPELQEIADQIGDALDTRVTIQGSAKKGTIIIEFAGAQDLQRITQAIQN
jgi:ParB family chromosome partitioning protein